MTERSEHTVLNRDCAATAVPNGAPLILQKGTSPVSLIFNIMVRITGT